MECKLIPLFSGDEVVAYAIVDAQSHDFLAQWQWGLSGSGYARRRIGLFGRNFQVYMHRVVLGLPDDAGLQGDHINGNRLDNRRTNLRPASLEENARNRFAQDGKMGGIKYKGVFAQRGTKNVTVRIRVMGRTLYLGSFSDQEVAAKVYDEAAIHHFGPRAKLNFPRDDARPFGAYLGPGPGTGELTTAAGSA
jgi:hypothetical protein